MGNEPFNDYYEILQISPKADRETIDRVYHFLARRYHPDNNRTGDAIKFDLITKAHRVLSDPERRAAFEAKYASARGQRWNLFFKESPTDGAETDKKIYQEVLSLLYIARKRQASNPGVGIVELEKLLGFPENHLEFHIWYLKEKGWIQRDESGGYAITAGGVDTVIENNLFLNKDRFLPAEGESSARDEVSDTNPVKFDSKNDATDH